MTGSFSLFFPSGYQRKICEVYLVKNKKRQESGRPHFLPITVIATVHATSTHNTQENSPCPQLSDNATIWGVCTPQEFWREGENSRQTTSRTCHFSSQTKKNRCTNNTKTPSFCLHDVLRLSVSFFLCLENINTQKTSVPCLNACLEQEKQINERKACLPFFDKKTLAVFQFEREKTLPHYTTPPPLISSPSALALLTQDLPLPNTIHQHRVSTTPLIRRFLEETLSFLFSSLRLFPPVSTASCLVS